MDNKNLDVSILYAAQELEPYLRLKENKKLELVPVPKPKSWSDYDTGNPWMDSINYRLDGCGEAEVERAQGWNGSIRRGFDTPAKSIIRYYLQDLMGWRGVRTNITHLYIKHNDSYNRQCDPEREAELYHVPKAVETVKFSSFFFERLLPDIRQRDRRDQQQGSGYFQKGYENRRDGVIIFREDFEKMIEKSNNRRNEEFKRDLNDQNFHFYLQIAPEWIKDQVKKRNSIGLEFNLLDNLAIKVQPEDKLLITHI